MALRGLIRTAAVCACRLSAPSPIPPSIRRFNLSAPSPVPSSIRRFSLYTKESSKETESGDEVIFYRPVKLRESQYTHLDLPYMMDQLSKGDDSVLPSIADEIVFRRGMRMFRGSPTNLHRYFLGVVMPDSSIPQRDATGQFFLLGEPLHLGEDGQVLIGGKPILLNMWTKRILYFLKYLDNQGSKETVPEEEVNKWKEMFREFRPSCYRLLPREVKKHFVHVAVGLGEMCERGEMKGEDAYDLLKKIGEDMGKGYERYQYEFLP